MSTNACNQPGGSPCISLAWFYRLAHAVLQHRLSKMKVNFCRIKWKKSSAHAGDLLARGGGQRGHKLRHDVRQHCGRDTLRGREKTEGIRRLQTGWTLTEPLLKYQEIHITTLDNKLHTCQKRGRLGCVIPCPGCLGSRVHATYSMWIFWHVCMYFCLKNAHTSHFSSPTTMSA